MTDMQVNKVDSITKVSLCAKLILIDGWFSSFNDC